MAKSSLKSSSANKTRQIGHTRLYEDSIFETKYELFNQLGEGSFGTVYRVRSKENDLFYALKIISKKVNDSSLALQRRRLPLIQPGNRSKASSLDNEVKLLKEVNHPNLIQLHEVLESSQVRRAKDEHLFSSFSSLESLFNRRTVSRRRIGKICQIVWRIARRHGQTDSREISQCSLLSPSNG